MYPTFERCSILKEVNVTASAHTTQEVMVPFKRKTIVVTGVKTRD